MARKTKKPRKNPVRAGKHPDLFERLPPSSMRERDDTPYYFEDWRDANADMIREAVRLGQIEDDELEELTDEIGETDSAFAKELEKLGESSREERTKRFIEYFRGSARWQIEYETEPNNDGYHHMVNQFQLELENIGEKKLFAAAREVLGDVEVDNDTLEQALRDPGNYEFVLNKDEYARKPDGMVWTWGVGALEHTTNGYEYDEELRRIMDGGTYYDRRYDEAGNVHGEVEEFYPYMTDADIEWAVEELERHEPYVTFRTFGRENKADREYFVDGGEPSMRISETDGWWFAAVLNADALKASLEIDVDEDPEKAPPIAYSYAGTNATIAGAEGRGMYVADLRPADLKKESAALGHCIGREDLGHPKLLRQGLTRVFSIRTESGKPKFTIELKKVKAHSQTAYSIALGALARGVSTSDIVDEFSKDRWIVAEVKGKANRLPGFDTFEVTRSTKLTKPIDVRLVCEFLTSLGYSPEQLRNVNDLAPGIRAMEEAGVSPFEPPGKRKKNPSAPRSSEGPFPVSPRVVLLATFARPMGKVREPRVRSRP